MTVGLFDTDSNFIHYFNRNVFIIIWENADFNRDSVAGVALAKSLKQ